MNDLSLQRADITYSYIPRADAVLFLLDAGQILKESERVFLNDKLLKASRDKIVFVITKWDLLVDRRAREALAYAKKQLGEAGEGPGRLPGERGDGARRATGRRAACPSCSTHLTRFLAEERGRILLDNALGEGLAVGTLLVEGRRRAAPALAMKSRRARPPHRSCSRRTSRGRRGRSSSAAMKIREEVAGISVGAQKDLDRFVDDVIRQLPNVIDVGQGRRAEAVSAGVPRGRLQQWAEDETSEIAASLEALAEKTIALVREDAHETTRRVAEALGARRRSGSTCRSTPSATTSASSRSSPSGLGVMFANVLLGGLLALAAPVLAVVVRDRVDEEYKKRAKEQAPGVLRAAAAKVGPKLDEMIDDFAAKLDAWVVTAGEELHREVLEVLHATQKARAAGNQDDEAAKRQTEEQAARIAKAITKLEELRGNLWVPKGAAAAVAMPVAEPPPSVSTTA